MASLQFKNTEIHYSTSGTGKTVVFLHGFLESLEMWHQIIPHVSQNYQVICIDLLGHGKTGNLGYIHTMEMQAEIVHYVLNKLKIKNCIVIGHSMGGYVALAFAKLHPQYLQGLSLMNSTSYADSPENIINRDRGIKAVKYKPEIFVKMAIPNLFSEENKEIFSKEIKEITKEALKISQQGIIAAMEGMKVRKNQANLYHSLNIPIQLIIGRQDPALAYDSLIAQSENTKVKVVEFPDGHMSHIENKLVLIEALKNFIATCYS